MSSGLDNLVIIVVQESMKWNRRLLAVDVAYAM